MALVLGLLGIDDARVALNNRKPQVISPSELSRTEAEWLELRNAELDLEEAISTSGTLEVDALLVPLALPGGGPTRMLVETRDPRRLELFRQLHFGQDSEAQKAAFRLAQHEALHPRSTLRGLRLRGMVARSNAAKLTSLAQEGGLSLDPAAFILVEGREPSPGRGFFFLAMALAALIKAVTLLRRKNA